MNIFGYDIETLKKERWLCYLTVTEYDAVNRERVARIADISGRETLKYVLRTLEILDREIRENTAVSERQALLIRRVLQWSETAKGGTLHQRRRWLEKGYPLAIHNLASAMIYAEEQRKASMDNPEDACLIELLIRTHGGVGQCIRGECSVSSSRELIRLKNDFSDEELYQLLFVLNKCIIKGVGDQLWTAQLEEKVQKLCRDIVEDTMADLPPAGRLQRLSSIYRNCTQAELEKSALLFSGSIFPRYDLWFFESALSDFSVEEVYRITEGILAFDIPEEVSYISFKPLQDTLYYDYEGKKKINVYRKRIIEKCLKNRTNDNVRLQLTVQNSALLVDFEFSAVCEKLIDFCVEAEQSGILTFEKSITVLYDMFGFRRDEFDRLNNEDKYLATMNDTEESTKNSIIDFAAGRVIVDVGSGGGVLLDLLEHTYPDRQIVGTDISENVIGVLNEKRAEEGHSWLVVRHNFVDSALQQVQPDTVIFSSILHEIFSYTQTAQGRFQIDSVKKALTHAYESLPLGGRIIIRDGVKSPSDDAHDRLAFAFKDRSGLDFFRNYCSDFKGLPEVDRSGIRIDGLQVEGDYNFMREFLYTYTWGTESYASEVNEQFGYFTLQEFKAFFTGLGAKILKAEEFVEPGYIEHLSGLVTLKPEDYPMSNCIVVVEK